MSEEEIRNVTADIKALYSVMYNFEDCLKDRMQEKVDNIEKFINSLLDLYNKEKEKKESYKKDLKLLVEEIDIKYISKDKIRDLIAERKFELQQEFEDFDEDIVLKVLNELLEE